MAVTGALEMADDAIGADDGPSGGRAPNDPPSFDQPRVALIVLLLAVALPILVATVNLARQPWLPVSDEGLIMIRALDVPSHLPLLGAYSRFGFDHPGPLLFYVLAGPAHLFGPAGLLLMSGAINAAAATGCCYVAWRRGGIVLATATAIVVLLFAHAMGPALISPWNPWVAVLPYLLSVMLAWGVSQRDWRLLPWLVLSASYSAQAHISYAPFAGLLVLGALVWAAFAWRGAARRDRADRDHPGQDHADRRSPSASRPSGLLLGATLGLLVLLWLPPLVQQFQADDGNLSKIARHFLTDHSNDESRGPFTDTTLPDKREVLGIVAREFGSLPPWIGASEEIEPFTSNVTGANLLLLPAPFLVFAVAFALAWRRRLRDAVALQSIVLGLVVLSAATMTRITGGLAPYIVRWTWVPACLLTLSTVWSCARALGAGAPASGTTTRATRTTMAWPTSVALASVAVLAAVIGVGLLHVKVNDAGLSDMALHVIDATQQHLPAGKEVRVNAAGGNALPVAGGIEAELIRRGVPVVVDPAVINRYGTHRLGSDPHPATVTLVTGADQKTFVPTATQQLVATFDPLTPAEHADHDEIMSRLVQNYAALGKGGPLPFTITPAESERYTEMNARGEGITVYVDPGS